MTEIGIILIAALVIVVSQYSAWRYYQDAVEEYIAKIAALSGDISILRDENFELRDQTTQVVHTIFKSKLASEIVDSMTQDKEEKIIGLESDLDAAVEIIWKYGDDNAKEWVRIHYPKFYIKQQMAKSDDQSNS